MPDLATIWFVLLGVLFIGYAVLDGFDLGVGVLHLVVARRDDERRALISSIGPVWDGNEVWLITAGGALFAAFPLVYATVFSGFYLALMLLLVALIFRAVALEFRSKEESRVWRTGWDMAFSVGSLLTALLLGVAAGNIVLGLPLGADGLYADGLIGLLNPFSLLVGLLAVAMVTMQGASWLIKKTEGAVQARARRAALIAWVAYGVLWILVTIAAALLLPDRFQNFLDNPLAWLAPAFVVASIVGYPILVRSGRELAPFLASSLSVAALVLTMGLAIFPDLVPSSGNGESLGIGNASSSDLTLGVMLVIALLGMPLVLLYTGYVYSRFWGKVGSGGHGY